MSFKGLMSLKTEDSDIHIFSEKDDLFSPDSLVQEFNQKMISQQIDFGAYRAKMVVDAQAQIMLARYQAEDPDQVINYQNKAESIAYQLGDAEYNGIDTPSNPFDDPALSAAWNNGYNYRAHVGKTQSQINLEQKLWEQGIDTDSQDSQFELAAITLFNMALRTKNDTVRNRCKRLALEMASYGHDLNPTPKRQHQLNIFLAKQTERIAQDIDIEEFLNV